MNTDASNTEATVMPGRRLKFGILIFILSVVLPLAGIPLLTSLDLSKTITASISGGLLVGAEVLGIVAVAVMGKQGYLMIKSHVIGFLKQYGPPALSYRAGDVPDTHPVWLDIHLPR